MISSENYIKILYEIETAVHLSFSDTKEKRYIDIPALSREINLMFSLKFFPAVCIFFVDGTVIHVKIVLPSINNTLVHNCYLCCKV